MGISKEKLLCFFEECSRRVLRGTAVKIWGVAATSSYALGRIARFYVRDTLVMLRIQESRDGQLMVVALFII